MTINQIVPPLEISSKNNGANLKVKKLPQSKFEMPSHMPAESRRPATMGRLQGLTHSKSVSLPRTFGEQCESPAHR